mgnify:CR=1 FL=1|jgi:hypothetical protein
MNCLNHIVGIRCQGDQSSSGLYIEDLEGINLKTAAQIADSRYQSGLDLIAKKKDFAIKAIVNDVRASLLPYYRTNTVVDELQVGEFKTTSLSTSPLRRGLKVKTRSSNLLKVRIQWIEVQIVETKKKVNIYVQDGSTNHLFEVETDNDGFARINVDLLSETKEVVVYIQDDTITPFDAYVKNGCNCYTKRSEFLHSTGFKSGETASSTFGLSVQALAECDNEALICLLSNQLGFAILYKTGIEIVKEWIASDRLNPVTIIDDGTEEFLLDNFEREYKKQLSLLQTSISRLLNNIDEICVVCSGNHYTEGIP